MAAKATPDQGTKCRLFIIDGGAMRSQTLLVEPGEELEHMGMRQLPGATEYLISYANDDNRFAVLFPHPRYLVLMNDPANYAAFMRHFAVLAPIIDRYIH
jgi:hypothetical protein